MEAEKSGRQRPTEAGPLAPLSAVPLPVAVRLGSTTLTLGELLSLQVGAVLSLDQTVSEPAAILVGERVIAFGQMVTVGERLGIRVTALAEERAEA